MAIELVQPRGVGHEAWAAITDQTQRLDRAIASSDGLQTVGCAKELDEAVARVVLDARGEVVGNGEEYQRVLNRAHGALERQPGPGLADDATIRVIATSTKQMAGQLRELRNNYGSGHGRAYVPEVCKEILDVCVDAALLWCRWALRRLEFVIAGSPIALARDIRGPFVFYSGDLTRRLIAANLSNLPVADQHMLGVAVAHRAATGTFLVRIEGVEACASSTDQELWPPGYREGVVEGLFIGAVGSISADVASVMNSALILSAHPAAEKAIEALLEKAIHASWSSAFAGNGAGRDAVNAAMQEYARLLVESAREPWGELRRLVTIQPD